MENNKLFVGGVSWNTSEEDLKEVFWEVWEVLSAKIIKDKETQKSKWFAFVLMDSPESAQAAIARFHGQELDWRNLTVNIAKPMEPKSRTDFHKRRGANDDEPMGRSDFHKRRAA